MAPSEHGTHERTQTRSGLPRVPGDGGAPAGAGGHLRRGPQQARTVADGGRGPDGDVPVGGGAPRVGRRRRPAVDAGALRGRARAAARGATAEGAAVNPFDPHTPADPFGSPLEGDPADWMRAQLWERRIVALTGTLDDVN